MRSLQKHSFIALLFILLLVNTGYGKVQPARYGLDFKPDSVVLGKMALHTADSMLKANPQIAKARVVMDIEHERMPTDRTADFYLLLSLCLMLGIIRTGDPRYFSNLFKAFRNTTLSNRQLKEQLQGAALPNLLMNVFFTIVGGAYIYYIVRYFTPQRHGEIPPSLTDNHVNSMP